MSQTRHEPVTARRLLLSVGSPGVELYAAMDVRRSGGDHLDHLVQLEDVLTAGWPNPKMLNQHLGIGPTQSAIRAWRTG